MEAETRFRAMGSDVHVIVVGGTLHLLDIAHRFVDILEAKWSRFRPTSEISLLNEHAGGPVHVSGETLALVEHGVEGARVTGGRYDPTVLGAVVRAGYDRSFELLSEISSDGESSLGFGYDRIQIDRSHSTVALPPGVGFDPGGIGKGYAADLLVMELLSRGAAGVCANVGGDLRVQGAGPGGGSWTVGVEHPLAPESLQRIVLLNGAVATSTRTRRRWGPADDRRHHLIDPATGRPASSGLSSATAIAAEGWQAEVMAKGAFVAGLSEGLVMLASTGTEGILVDDSGTAYPSAGLHRFTESSLQEDVPVERIGVGAGR
jgi:FAD:protein FMN transferase